MRDTLDPMAPEASPGTLSKRSGVRRVNNVPMYLLGGVMIAFVLMMMVSPPIGRRSRSGPRARRPRRRGARLSLPGRSPASRRAG